jgi:hypothetical protein
MGVTYLKSRRFWDGVETDVRLGERIVFGGQLDRYAQNASDYSP